MKVFLTGGTGFVGRQIVNDLMKRDVSLRCLVRKGSEVKLPLEDSRVEAIHGDIRNAESLKGKLQGCDAVIHLVGIIREYPRKGITFEKIHFQGAKNLIDVAAREGVKRFVLMSALGADLRARSTYHITKAKAEEYLSSSGMTYTVIRPSIIFGEEDQFVNTFARMIKRAPFVPVIGDGQYRLQPISVKNISEAFIMSIGSPAAEYQSFDAGGPDQLTFNTILDCIGEALGEKVRKMHVPVFVFKPIVTLMQKLPSFPVTRDQMEMLLSGSVCDEKQLFEVLPIKPIPFKDGIKSYLSR